MAHPRKNVVSAKLLKCTNLRMKLFSIQVVEPVFSKMITSDILNLFIPKLLLYKFSKYNNLVSVCYCNRAKMAQPSKNFVSLKLLKYTNLRIKLFSIQVIESVFSKKITTDILNLFQNYYYINSINM